MEELIIFDWAFVLFFCIPVFIANCRGINFYEAMLYAVIFFSKSLDGFTMLILNQAGIWLSISGSTTCPGLTVPTVREWIRIRTPVCPCLLWRNQIQTQRPGSVALDTILLTHQFQNKISQFCFYFIYSQRMS